MDQIIWSMQYTIDSLLKKHGEVMCKKVKNFRFGSHSKRKLPYVSNYFSLNTCWGSHFLLAVTVIGVIAGFPHVFFVSFCMDCLDIGTNGKTTNDLGKTVAERLGSFRFVDDQEMIFLICFRHDFPMLFQ